MIALLPILILIVILLGVTYLRFLRESAGAATAWKAVAITGVIAGAPSVILTAFAAVFSLTPFLEGAPLRDWLAAISFLGIPIAAVGIGCGGLTARSPARAASITGIGLSAASLVAWVVMVMTLGR